LRRWPGLLLPASFHSPAPGPAPPRDDGGSGWTSRPRASPRREPAMTPLRRRMTEDLILHDRSPKTIRLSIHWVADFARHFHASPDRLGPEHVRSYPLHLIQERKVPCYVHKQARLALRSFYRITRASDWVVAEVARPEAPKTLPVVLSQDEMARFREALHNPKHRASLRTAYAGGLRLAQVAGLRVEVIDSPRMVLHVRQGKGHKD